jgi:hypothetical protein
MRDARGEVLNCDESTIQIGPECFISILYGGKPTINGIQKTMNPISSNSKRYLHLLTESNDGFGPHTYSRVEIDKMSSINTLWT